MNTDLLIFRHRKGGRSERKGRESLKKRKIKGSLPAIKKGPHSLEEGTEFVGGVGKAWEVFYLGRTKNTLGGRILTGNLARKWKREKSAPPEKKVP